MLYFRNHGPGMAAVPTEPYRAAWSREMALAYIQAEARSHFDPQVVEVFVDLIQRRGVDRFGRA
jgi:HD-GYP domain-containing protein (c-di-GMP phosphodiesterase class II)